MPRDQHLLDFDPLEVARQLTILGSRLYQGLKPSDLLERGLGSGNITRVGDSIVEFSKYMSKVNSLVTNTSHCTLNA